MLKKIWKKIKRLVLEIIYGDSQDELLFTGLLLIMLVVLAFCGGPNVQETTKHFEEAAVQMPMKTVASLIVIVALGTMGYFQIVERLNVADTRIQLMEKDLTENTEFRIKWPRGQLGSFPRILNNS